MVKPRFTPAKKERELFKASPALARIATGMAQGFGLFALFQLQGVMDPFVFSGALMVLLFAPLLLLAGLGRMRFAPLLVWTIFASGLLAAVGAYHHWRIQDSASGHPGLVLLALTSLFLFVAQSIVNPARGRLCQLLSQRLAAFDPHCAVRAVRRAVLGGGGRRRGLYAGTLSASAIFAADHSPGGDGRGGGRATDRREILGALQEGLLFVFTMALPFWFCWPPAVAGLGAPGSGGHRWRSLAHAWVAFDCRINASYRDGTAWRSYWRRRSEFAGGLVLVPLAMLAALALAARVQAIWLDRRPGFCRGRVMLFGGYALFYAGVALISLGGGGWMERIEGSNLALAFSGLMLIGVLASPLADPARLAVASAELPAGAAQGCGRGVRFQLAARWGTALRP